MQTYRGTSGHLGTAPAGGGQVPASPGGRLEPRLQQDTGRHVGHDFRRVRVHTDAKVVESARTVSARAYTVGRDTLPVLPRQVSVEAGPVDDPLEDDADRIARDVMHAPSPITAPRCACGGTPGPDGECAACRASRLAGATTRAAPSLGSAPPSVAAALSQPGRPLDLAARSFFEPRLGTDLSMVRVHDDARAARSARDVAAHAYTVGTDVVFGIERYQPTSHAGRSLLAHELAHVVQQRRGRTPVRIQRQAVSRIDRGVDLDQGSPTLAALAREAERREQASALGVSTPAAGPSRATVPLRELFSIPPPLDAHTLFNELKTDPGDDRGPKLAGRYVVGQYLSGKLDWPVTVELLEREDGVWFAFTVQGEEIVDSRKLQLPLGALDAVSTESLSSVTARAAQIVEVAALEAAFPDIIAAIGDLPETMIANPKGYARNDAAGLRLLTDRYQGRVEALSKNLSASNEWLREVLSARRQALLPVQERVRRADVEAQKSLMENWPPDYYGEVYDRLVSDSTSRVEAAGWGFWRWLGDAFTLGGQSSQAQNVRMYRRGEISYNAYRKNWVYAIGMVGFKAVITALTAGRATGPAMRLLGLEAGASGAATVVASTAEGVAGGFAQGLAQDAYAYSIAYVSSSPGVVAFHEQQILGPDALVAGAAESGTLGMKLGVIGHFMPGAPPAPVKPAEPVRGTARPPTAKAAPAATAPELGPASDPVAPAVVDPVSSAAGPVTDPFAPTAGDAVTSAAGPVTDPFAPTAGDAVSSAAGPVTDPFAPTAGDAVAEGAPVTKDAAVTEPIDPRVAQARSRLTTAQAQADAARGRLRLANDKVAATKEASTIADAELALARQQAKLARAALKRAQKASARAKAGSASAAPPDETVAQQAADQADRQLADAVGRAKDAATARKAAVTAVSKQDTYSGRWIAKEQRATARLATVEASVAEAERARLVETRLEAEAERLRGMPRDGEGLPPAWDSKRFPAGPRRGWKPGESVDMPDPDGIAPNWSTIRRRVWRTRAIDEMAERARRTHARERIPPTRKGPASAVAKPQRGLSTFDPFQASPEELATAGWQELEGGLPWLDPIREATNTELASIAESGVMPRRLGAEIEHARIPQRIGRMLEKAAADKTTAARKVTRSQVRKLTKLGDPSNLMPTRKEIHAIVDEEARQYPHRNPTAEFSLDSRSEAPFREATDGEIGEIVQWIEDRGIDLGKTDEGVALRGFLKAEKSLRPSSTWTVP